MKGIPAAPPIGWQIWLSMNPEMDATAIWLERKFDVPTSGQWLGESIFAMRLEPAEESETSPGVIVFERTPLEGVSDEIERSLYLSSPNVIQTRSSGTMQKIPRVRRLFSAARYCWRIPRQAPLRAVFAHHHLDRLCACGSRLRFRYHGREARQRWLTCRSSRFLDDL